MKVVLAIPTVESRGDAWQRTGEAFRALTPVPLIVEPGYREGGWATGLTEVWEKHPDADVFVCCSDDMEPLDENWLPPLLGFLDEGKYPAPKMLNHDPSRGYWEYPGTWEKPAIDGAPSKMSTFPVLKGEWLDIVFPIGPREPQHYYSDDLIAEKLRRAGIECVACPSSVIVHNMAHRDGESERMEFDRAVFAEWKAANRVPR